MPLDSSRTMTNLREIEVPAGLRKNMERLRGGQGIPWLESLPGIVADLSEEWGIRAVSPFEKQSYNFTAVAILGDGTEAVLKVGYPEEEQVIAKQASVLELYGPKIAPEIYRHDLDRRALLIEKLDPGGTLYMTFGGDPDGAVDVAVGILKALPREVPGGARFQSLAEWFAVLEAETSKIIPGEVLDAAKDALGEIGIDGNSLLHADFHHGNILASGVGEFKVIDPEGAVGALTYEAAVFLNEHLRLYKSCEDIDERISYALARFGDALETGIDEIVQWAFCQAVQCMAWDAEDFGEFYEADLTVSRYWLDRMGS